MSDRLNELQRQRALAQEQVAWFDREIARERGAPALPATPKPAPLVASAAVPAGISKPVATTSPAEADVQAEEIIQRYQKTERPIRDDVRRGCFIYFFSAFLLLALGVVAFYLLHRPSE